MRIGIDARKIRDTGIGRYIDNLVNALLRVDADAEYVLFLAPEDADSYSYPRDRVTKVIETSGKYSVREHWSLPLKVKKSGVDLFHAPHYVLPYFMSVPSVVTVHDIIHLIGPGFGPVSRAYARLMIGSAVARARLVITVSESTGEDLKSALGVPERKIRVIPNGGGSDFERASDSEIKKVLDAFGLAQGRYYLFVGSDRPHKNLEAVFETLRLMDDAACFAIVGRVRDERKRDFDAFGGRVRFIDSVGKDTIRALYSGAIALLFPSIYEGFGLPPLEAMACGTPVVASNSSSIPEVVGDAAALVDPRDWRSMAETLTRIRADKAFRDAMVARGRQRVRLFSWDTMAEKTLKVYEEALS